MDERQKLSILKEWVGLNPDGIELFLWLGLSKVNKNLKVWNVMSEERRVEVFDQNWQDIMDALLSYHNDRASWHMRQVGNCLAIKREMKATQAKPNERTAGQP